MGTGKPSPISSPFTWSFTDSFMFSQLRCSLFIQRLSPTITRSSAKLMT